MKKNWRNKPAHGTSYIAYAGMIVLLLALLACTGKEQAHEHDTYTCPMHPTVVSDRQGTCPVCGMDLVRKARPGEEVEITEDLARAIKSPNESIIASIKTIRGEFKSMPLTVQAQGILTYDTRSLYTIAARAGGRLEKVYLKYAFQPVRKGQKVAEIYSPELVAAQRELLYLLESDAGNTDLIAAARNKLYLLGASVRQVDELIRRKEPATTFAVYSPYDGYITDGQNAAPTVSPGAGTTSARSSGSGMSDGMGSTATTPAPATMGTPSASTALIREGNYVAAGQTLFRIVDPSALRVELNLPADQGSSIKAGDEATLALGTGVQQKTKVGFVQPFFSENEAFVKVRVYIRHEANMSIGQLVSATISAKPVEALWFPATAVLDTGLEKIVFIKTKGVLKPKNVKITARHQDRVALQGLTSSDEIAANAQYLVDSESFIKTNE